MANIVYIATSLDGFIADKDGGLDWLHSIPNPEQDDMGFSDFMQRIDALVMGRNTFEMVCSFGGDWPYIKPVAVLSHTLTEIPEAYRDKAFLVKGKPDAIVAELSQRGMHTLYIDGGQTIQSFLQADQIDELIISRLPVLLGGGIPLFGQIPNTLKFEHKNTKVLLNAIVQSHYVRSR